MTGELPSEGTSQESSTFGLRMTQQDHQAKHPEDGPGPDLGHRSVKWFCAFLTKPIKPEALESKLDHCSQHAWLQAQAQPSLKQRGVILLSQNLIPKSNTRPSWHQMLNQVKRRIQQPLARSLGKKKPHYWQRQWKQRQSPKPEHVFATFSIERHCAISKNWDPRFCTAWIKSWVTRSIDCMF